MTCPLERHTFHTVIIFMMCLERIEHHEELAMRKYR